jgi:hypothetical protein
MKKERQTRLTFNDTYDIIYKLSYRLIEKRPYIEIVRTIIYTPRDLSITSITIL